MDTWHAPSLRRWTVAVAGLLFTGYAFWGVSSFRQWGERIGVDVSSWWYAAAVIPPLAALVVALLVPTRRAVWQNSRAANVLICVVIASQIHIPLIYARYDFEGLSREQNDSQKSSVPLHSNEP